MSYLNRVIDKIAVKPVRCAFTFFPIMVLLELVPMLLSAFYVPITFLVTMPHSTEEYMLGSLLVLPYAVLFFLVRQIIVLMTAEREEDVYDKIRRRWKEYFCLIVVFFVFESIVYSSNEFYGWLVSPPGFNAEMFGSPIPYEFTIFMSAAILFGFSGEIRHFFDRKALLQGEKVEATSEIGTERDKTTVKADPTAIQLRGRAFKARIGAVAVIFLIIFSLGGAALILAETIQDTRFDAPRTQRAQLESERETLTEQLIDARRMVIDLLPESFEVSEIFSEYSIDFRRVTDYARSELSGSIEEGQQRSAREQLIDSAESYERIANNLRRATEHIAQLPEEGDLLSEQNQFLYLTLQSIFVRIASVVLILFFVRLLFNLYRYTTRLAASYDSQADAIELVNHNAETLSLLLSALSPERYDFGASPKGPVDQAIEIVKAMRS